MQAARAAIAVNMSDLLRINALVPKQPAVTRVNISSHPEDVSDLKTHSRSM
jgi:hypothetical protein